MSVERARDIWAFAWARCGNRSSYLYPVGSCRGGCFDMTDAPDERPAIAQIEEAIRAAEQDAVAAEREGCAADLDLGAGLLEDSGPVGSEAAKILRIWAAAIRQRGQQ